MKKNQTNNRIILCVCGASYEVNTQILASKFEICSNCHPFYTGKKRNIDTLGRVEKFKEKFKGRYEK